MEIERFKKEINEELNIKKFNGPVDKVITYINDVKHRLEMYEKVSIHLKSYVEGSVSAYVKYIRLETDEEVKARKTKEKKTAKYLKEKEKKLEDDEMLQRRLEEIKKEEAILIKDIQKLRYY